MEKMKTLTINDRQFDIHDDEAVRFTEQTLTDEQKAQARANIGVSEGNDIEPAEEDIPKVFFGAALPQTKDDTVMTFRYISKTEDISGYCKTKAQGNSSMAAPKKNQTVKLYKDADCTEKLKVDFKGWGKQHKFCFKANWIDLTHARNIVSARLWGDVVKSRANYDTIPELLRTSPNQGAVDGFPVKVYANGIYQGRYTLNIPKDAWMANMDDELDNHCILCGENYVSGCFRAEANIDESDWTDEIHETVPASIRNRWNDAIRFVMNSSDEEFVAGIGSYFDVNSLIDYYIFGLVTCNNDGFGKNQLYMTYDGLKWYATVYDMDNTFGTYLGGILASDFSRMQYEDFKNANGNLLFVRLESLFNEEIQARYEELKSGALSKSNIIDRFERFTDITPPYLVEEDYASTTAGGAFTGIPLQNRSNIQQIRNFVVERHAYVDYYVENLNNSPQAEAIVWNDNSNVLGNGNVVTESGISCTNLIDLKGATKLVAVASIAQSGNMNQYRVVYYDADMKCLGYKDIYNTAWTTDDILVEGTKYIRINTVTVDKKYCDYITDIRDDKSIGFTALPSYKFVLSKKPSASGEEATTNNNGYYDEAIPVSAGDVFYVYNAKAIKCPDATVYMDRDVYGYDADGNFVGVISGLYSEHGHVRAWKIPEGVASVKVAVHNTASELCSYKIISENDNYEDSEIIDGNVLYQNFTPNGESFQTEVAIDWDTQYIEASIDLSSYPYIGQYHALFNVGQDISTWNEGKTNMHIYYIPSARNLNVGFFNNYQQYGNMIYTLDTSKIILRLDKNGVHLNGELLAPYEDYRKGYYEDALKQLMALDTVQVGAHHGDTQSYATYEYIAVKNAK